jgi:hypothetical protein
MAIIPAELRRTDLRDSILKAMLAAYEVNRERHDPALGDTALTFGIHTWTSSTHYLQIEMQEVPGASSAVVNQSLEITLGRCRLRVLKLGNSETDNPWHCFPDHAGPAARMGRFEQLEFRLGLEEIEPLDWVIGHYGSAEDGLRAVRLQAVGSERSEDGRITKWNAVETIYEPAGDVVPLTVIAGDQADSVNIPEPDVALKPESPAEEVDRSQPS